MAVLTSRQSRTRSGLLMSTRKAVCQSMLPRNCLKIIRSRCEWIPSLSPPKSNGDSIVNVRITGTGSALPAKILTNAELEKLVDTSNEWITSRTGISERRIAAEGEYTSTFAAEAARRAMSMAGVQPEEIDLIILSTITPDFPFPSTACIVQDLLGAKNATAFDISAACAGFIFGLSVAVKYIRSGAAQKILVIGSETLSCIVDWKDRNTCVL